MQIESSKPIISLQNISVSFDDQFILKDITADIKKGDYVGIVGPNGSGKTTLLKIILGTLKPTQGTVKIFDTAIEDFRQREEIGYVPQRSTQSEFNFPATVEEVVESGRAARVKLFGDFGPKDRQAIETAFEVTELRGQRHQLISELSGGQRQRVFIARALAAEPKILILDEPDIGVDINSQKKFYDFIKKLNKEFNMTVLLVSHDIELIASQVSTVICLNHGLVCHVSTQDFMKEEYVEQLYGKPAKTDHYHH